MPDSSSSGRPGPSPRSGGPPQLQKEGMDTPKSKEDMSGSITSSAATR